MPATHDEVSFNGIILDTIFTVSDDNEGIKRELRPAIAINIDVITAPTATEVLIGDISPSKASKNKINKDTVNADPITFNAEIKSIIVKFVLIFDV